MARSNVDTYSKKSYALNATSPLPHPWEFQFTRLLPPNLVLQCRMANGSIFRFFDLLSCKGWKLVLLLIQFGFTLAILVKLPPKFSCSDYPGQRIEPSFFFLEVERGREWQGECDKAKTAKKPSMRKHLNVECMVNRDQQFVVVATSV